MTFKCNECGVTCPDAMAMLEHYEQHHPESWLGKRAAKEIRRAQRETPKA